jgi:hypothetical protein
LPEFKKGEENQKEKKFLNQPKQAHEMMMPQQAIPNFNTSRSMVCT